MLNLNIRKSNLPILNETNLVSSKKIGIDINLEGIIQVSFHDKNISEIIEKLIIDLFITKIDKYGDVYNSFSLILEKLNKELRGLSKSYNLENMNIFLGIVQGDIFHFTILGNYSIYLIKNNKIVDIADGMQGKNLEFSYISSGNVNIGDMIFLANLNLLDYITKDDIFEIIKTDKIDKLEIIEQILSQEAVSEQYNIISISNTTEKPKEVKNVAINVIKEKFISIADKIKENEKVGTIIEQIKLKIDLKNKYVYLTFLSIGLVISVLLLYAVIGSILSNQLAKSMPEQYKNKLIEAKLILDRTNKDIGNKEVFDANIKKAEDIIFEVRGKNVFLNDVNKLLESISVLKKQSNGIETFNLTSDKQEIVFKDPNFGIVGIFELNKKYYFVGKNSLIGPYIKGEEPKTYSYPDGEEIISADITPEGYIFLMTKTFRIIQFYKQEFKYVNVEGQKTWENGAGIKCYNSNIYVLSDKLNQIYRHKPSVNGFSAKSPLIDEKDTKTLIMNDFAVDGGFYVFKKDLSIDKFFSAPSYNNKSIVINGIKNTTYANKSNITPKMTVGQNLNYIYILMDNKIWIFEPDSKDYKSVKGVKYVGQLEPGEGTVNSIFVPNDGTIFVGNKSGVYSIKFEVSDNKVIVR